MLFFSSCFTDERHKDTYVTRMAQGRMESLQKARFLRLLPRFFNKQNVGLGSKISNVFWHQPLSFNQTPEALTSEQTSSAKFLSPKKKI